MAHQRTTSSVAGDALKEPHSVSLKVLRLSRPSLASQYPLPGTTISPAASLAYPSSNSDSFVLSPLLTLPPAFGNAYVGETFSCTLCANNELMNDERTIRGLKIEAEMKTPSVTTPLQISEIDNLGVGKSLQGIVEYHLKEEGSHVLSVTVSYTETGPTSGRLRTFRKLYQFVARACLVVRTKVGALSKGWALEAQLENSGEMIVLEAVSFETKPWCKASNFNEMGLMGPGDIKQVCFLVEQLAERDDAMGVLHISWRGAFGNRGQLSTGWLGKGQ